VTKTLYGFTWSVWRAVARRIRSAKRRDAFLSYFGPLALLMLFCVWVFGLIFAFAVLHWGIGSAINATPNETPTFKTDLTCGTGKLGRLN
jgi:hypothetical protein